MLDRYAKQDRVFFVLCSMSWMGIIYFLSSLPGDSLGPDHFTVNLIKKAGHFGLYGVLAALYLHAMGGRGALREAGFTAYAISMAGAVLYAVSDEYHQSYVPGRHAAAMDVAIDAFGAFAMLGTVYRWNRKQQMMCGGKT